MKTITIKEEFRLPGTNIILEKGDRIQVKEEKDSLKENQRVAMRIADELVELFVNNPMQMNWAARLIGQTLSDQTTMDSNDIRSFAKSLELGFEGNK